MKQGYKTLTITIVCFAIFLFLLKAYFTSFKVSLDGLTKNGLLSFILTYSIIGIPIYVGTYLIKPKLNILKNLGLSLNFLKPFLISTFFSLPMILGGLIFFDFNKNNSVPNLIAGTIVIGFVEELFFRGFFFGQIFKHTKFGFISSIILGATIFGIVHLYQSPELFELVGIFIVTFMGAIFFAWLYVEWNYNIWVPIFLHANMNLAWYLFEMDTTALGGVLPNIFRGLTIATAILFTIFYKRKYNIGLIITKDKLFIKKDCTTPAPFKSNSE